MADLFTIGYANKSLDEFLTILKSYKINCLIDVRSMPLSSQYPEYDENSLKKVLKLNDILYMSFKNEFGARRNEDEVYTKINMYDNTSFEVVNFEKVYDLDIFKQGVRRVERGIEQGYQICFLCSEKYAYDCHRCLMVGEYFNRLGYIVDHIVNLTYVLNQKNIEEFLENNFFSERKQFYKIYSEELQELFYGGGLIKAYDGSKNFMYWKDFFETFTYEKSVYLRNLEIGYKKGDKENG
ncbi:MAG: DUF488 domain-containing protein [Acholeplasmatales bacterium]|jgi:hypothetical protein|nr:DUF488 domain-containing protein [Acholeplasmatales bacterium]